MNIYPIRAVLALAAMMAALTGCGTHKLVASTTASTAASSDEASAHIEQLAAKIKQSQNDPEADTEVDLPFLAGNPVPLAREATLPLALRKGVKTELLFKGSDAVDLMEAAAQLTRATGIPIRVRPDALLPQSDFMPRSFQTVAGAAQPAPGQQDRSNLINLNVGEMEAADILNYIVAQKGLYWDWRPDAGVIDIYRLVNRTFEFRGVSGTGSVLVGLGRSGNQGGAFESNAATKFEQKDIDALKDIKTAIEAMMTKGGSGSITNGSIVVTDTKEAVEAIGAHIKSENRALTRRIRLVFEAIDVSTNDSGERGIDWSLVYSKITQKLSGDVTSSLTQLSPQSLVSDGAGRLGLGVVGNSRFDGSTVVLKALREVGNVVNVTRVPMTTLNRRPVQYAVRQNFDYVSSIQVNTVASSAGTTTAPQITQKEETVGTSLTITPAAFDDGLMTLNIAYDTTSLRELKPYSVGDKASTTNTVQQRKIDGSGTVQSIPIRSGQTLIVSGIERRNEQVTTSRLDDNAPLLAGGSDRAAKQKTTTVILITAVAEDGV